VAEPTQYIYRTQPKRPEMLTPGATVVGMPAPETAARVDVVPAWRVWFARAAVAGVFIVNVWCALAFIIDPESYTTGFEIIGVPGRVTVQSFGILFLMWNATYPPVMWDPVRHRTLFAVVLIQQAIGVFGELALWATLPPGYDILLATGLRFLRFDAAGLAIMAVAFLLTRSRHARPEERRRSVRLNETVAGRTA